MRVYLCVFVVSILLFHCILIPQALADGYTSPEDVPVTHPVEDDFGYTSTEEMKVETPTARVCVCVSLCLYFYFIAY
jgi:hypothetical protein